MGVLKGAATGATIGSVVPGLGTAAGAVIGGVAGALSGVLGAKSKKKAAEQEAKNQAAANKWKYKLDTATYGTEKMPGLKKAARTSSFRKQIAAAIAKNPKYGLQSLLPGYFNLEKEYTERPVVNPFEAAGAPPEAGVASPGLSGYASAALGGGE